MKKLYQPGIFEGVPAVARHVRDGKLDLRQLGL
jgi:hypothetical protein